MGDSCCNEKSMGKLKTIIEERIPGIYVHPIRIGKTEEEDKSYGFLDEIQRQVLEVCDTLKADENLKDGFNAIGFSQGGLFLRAYVQLCNTPPIKKLITFGSPHAGVADIPNCRENDGVGCSISRSLVKFGVYTGFVQHRVVQAQYYKMPSNLDAYLSYNIFLPYLNKEIDGAEALFKNNLKTLDKFVMVRFEDDDMVIPGKTAWFGFQDEQGVEIPMEKSDLYIQDKIGMKYLNENGRLVFDSWPGRHLQIDLEKFEKEIIDVYLKGDTIHQKLVPQDELR
jgi:palmitoyl-protein thioesterase